MAFTKVFTGAVVGLEAKLVEVEVNVDYMGFPGFMVVGLPSKEIEESKERVRSAIKNSKARFPDAKITVNLAPADFAKRGSSYDLPIALGILSASGQITKDVKDYFLFGELSLDGSINKVKGVIPMTELAVEKFKYVIAPKDNADEVSVISGIELKAISNLKELLAYMNGLFDVEKYPHSSLTHLLNDDTKDISRDDSFDYSQIKGMEYAKRAIEIAVAGGHSLSFSGPPGSGKTLLSKSIPTVMPQLNENDAFEILKINSVVNANSYSISEEKKIIRPFRAPHHTTSVVGLVGGGNPITPGEITLAHKGILFLDEFTEFQKIAIESLRQPIESKSVTITRASGTVTFPSDFMLVVAFNLCPCGYNGHPTKRCVCTPQAIKHYLSKISGPILDRIDLHVTCLPSSNLELSSGAPSRSSNDMIKTINRARARQSSRFNSPILNKDLDQSNIFKFIQLNQKVLSTLNNTSAKLGLSARSYHRVIKVARTIADIEDSDEVLESHILEATQYRKQF